MTGTTAVMFAMWTTTEGPTSSSGGTILTSMMPGLTAPVATLWAVWLFLVILFLVLSVYRSRITRDEVGQIFLDDTFARERDDEAAIHSRMAKVEPIVRITMWLTIAATLAVVGYYVNEFVSHLV